MASTRAPLLTVVGDAATAIDGGHVVAAVVVVAVGWAIKAVALCVIPGNRRPASAMAWLLLVLAAPLAGVALFWTFGRANIGRRRRDRRAEAQAAIRSATAGLVPSTADEPPYVPSVARLSRRLGSLPLQDGNAATLLPDYDASLAAMTAAVAEATTAVEVEFYITAWDEATAPFFEALVAAGERGVAIRLLLDHIGSRRIPGYRDLRRRLDAAPLEWRAMLPIRPLRGEIRRPDLRNHRKLLVVDGKVGFMGSQNLIEPGYDKPKNHAAGREWVDLGVRVEGPVVSALRAVFATDWYAETGENMVDELLARDPEAVPAGDVSCQVLPSGPGFLTENNLRVFTTLVYSAQRRVSITSPYFVPDEPLLYAVTTAAQRGVAVELFVSAEGDQFMVHHAQCSYYQALLEAGVRIFLYPAPAVLHSKHFSIDDDVAVVGSSNMDTRSFALNHEVSMMLTGGDAVQRLREVEDAYRAVSRELTEGEWQLLPRRTRAVNNVMRLTSALQ